MSDWRRKHALVKDEKQEVEERIRKLELYISDLPTPDDMVKQNSEISFLLMSSTYLSLVRPGLHLGLVTTVRSILHHQRSEV